MYETYGEKLDFEMLPPEKEPERQQYFLQAMKRLIAKREEILGRPLT